MIDGVHSGRDERPSQSLLQGRIPLMSVLAWTGFVAFVLWWLMNGNDGPAIWVFQERDLAQPGFSERVDAIFRSDLGLQRTYPWILFAPYLALMAWYFPLERDRLRRNLPLNAVACLAFVWACQGIHRRTTVTSAKLVMVSPGHAPAPTAPPLESAAPSTGTSGFPPAGEESRIQSMSPLPETLRRSIPPPGPPRRSLRATVRSMIVDLLAYGAVAGLVHSVNFHRRLRERERRALFLESTLAKARLNTLKAQLQPHFLFNSLNAIASLLRRDPRVAETTLVALSGMLRLALSQSEKQEGAFREELEFVERYLEIQQVRFGDKLKVELHIEPATLECQVPTLVLQPLVENAIRHGIEPADKPGTVRVGAFRSQGRLVLTVEDDGVGLDGGAPEAGAHEEPADLLPGRPASSQNSRACGVWVGAGTGIGLANLRERLQALYGARQLLQVLPRVTGGVVVRVEIPWQPRASSETPAPFEP